MSISDSIRACFPGRPGSGSGSGQHAGPTAHSYLPQHLSTVNGRQEPLEGGKGTAKMGLKTVVRSYAVDWGLVVVLW
jgi:hypothetical protein